MCVYFMLNSKKQVVKIGYSTDPHKRMGGVITGSSDELSIIGVIKDGSQKLEFAIQNLFAEFHIRGEWFEYSRKIQKFMIDYVWSGRSADGIENVVFATDDISVKRKSRLKSLSIDYLNTFVLVSDGKSLTEIGKLTGMSQPSISVRLGVIEEIFGNSLFNRDTKHITLNENGMKVLPFFMMALKAIEDSIEAVNENSS